MFTGNGIRSMLFGAAAGAAASSYAYASGMFGGKPSQASVQSQTSSLTVQDAKKQPKEIVSLIGDVGGTNVRLKLIKLNLETRTSSTIKELTKIPS